MTHFRDFLMTFGLGEAAALLAARAIAGVGVLILAWAACLLARLVLGRGIARFAQRTRTTWDDLLVQRKVFVRLAHLAPALVVYALVPVVLAGAPQAVTVVQQAAVVYLLLAGLLAVNAFLAGVVDIHQKLEFGRKMPIRSFVQAIKVVLCLLVGIAVVSILMGRSPVYLLGGLGAMAAVLMLIFKDSILGLVAGVHLSLNHMVKIGDWIEMPKYGANGSVVDVSLTTVKVQNWDMTISTIPTYALIVDSFKNWRGMTDSGGRRIMRSVHIDMTSIRFCTEQMLAKFKGFRHISDYVERKLEEIGRHNAECSVDESDLVNGRHLTNVGTFRAYLDAYLRDHPTINQDMTFLVRHLAPTERGLPIQIYVFCKDQRWVNYEGIQADIFDHVLAVIPEFGLRVFQYPTGAYFHAIRGGRQADLADPPDGGSTGT